MLNCTYRDDVTEDVHFLKKLASEYAEINKMKFHIAVVVNKCDEMAPTRHKNPQKYSKSKIEKINEIVHCYKDIIVKNE